MMPVALLSRFLTAARRFAPTLLDSAPGYLVARGPDAWIRIESPQVMDQFRCRDLPALSTFLRWLRGAIAVTTTGERTFLTASDRRLEVEPLRPGATTPPTEPAFAIRISRPQLGEAVARFARRDALCLLHYTHDALRLESEVGSSSLSEHRRTAGPVRIARAVSGHALRQVATTLRTDDLELQILGPWNGPGSVVISESEAVRGTRLTVGLRGDSYAHVRHLVLRLSPTVEPSVYSGLTAIECDEVAKFEEREHTAVWLRAREWDRHRLSAMAEDPDRSDERAELAERLEWEREKHGKSFADGCGLSDCDVCAPRDVAATFS